ncbi:MAG: FecR domain-containing protein [Bacteroidota bacterium]
MDNTNNINEDIIIRYLNGETLDGSIVKEVETWLSADEHLEEAKSIYQAWELYTLAATSSRDVNDAYLKLDEKLGSVKRSKHITISYWWYAAASIVLIGLSVFFFSTPENDEIKTLATRLKIEEYQLEDGTNVTLNEKSSLSYDTRLIKSGTNRTVSFEGEAYFDVAHRSENPFIVKTHDAEIKVLGTQFMVKAFSEMPTEVLVTEGRVLVKYLTSGEEIILSAKEEITTQHAIDKTEIVVAPSDENHLYWKTGVMKFEGDTLGKVFETLSEEFKTQIKVENEAILSCNITATFKKQSLETIIEVIKSTHQLKGYQNGDTVIIVGNGCQ